MAIRKRIPFDEEGFDLLLQSLDEKCPGYQTELNISAAQLAALHTNAVFYHGCRLVKSQINDTKTSLTKYVDKMFSGSSKEALPVAPNLSFELPALPAKPGIEEQTKKFIEFLELQDNFSDAIGLDLGFYEEVSRENDEEKLVGEFKVGDFSGYALEINFSKKGQEALDLNYRVKGTTDWTKIRLTSSPYTLEIPPDPNGLAVTIEMQGILISKNKPVGRVSDVKTVIAHA